MEAGLRIVGRLSSAAAGLAMVLVIALVVVMLNEVFSRYVLLRPRMYSLDLTLMLNGSLFMLATAYTLRAGGLIRIDFLSSRLPLRTQHVINLVFFLLCMVPILGILSYTGIMRTWAAYESGRREMASSWGPLVWPYYSALSLGCLLLWLQCVAESVRFAIGIRHPERVAAPGIADETIET